MTERVAIVTGAARGIGAAIAVRLAASGVAVGVIDLRRSRHRGDRGRDHRGRRARDRRGRRRVRRRCGRGAVERVATELAAPTVLVNNAGILRDNLMFKMTDLDWDAVMGVHLSGSFLMTRAVQAHQVAAQCGRIVNLSSTSALGNRGQANYAAAKAGLQGFTKTLAIELGPFGVTVKAIAPGIIATDMLRATAERIGKDVRRLPRRGNPGRSRSSQPATSTTSRRPPRSSARRTPRPSTGRCSTWRAARRPQADARTAQSRKRRPQRARRREERPTAIIDEEVEHVHEHRRASEPS